MPLYEYRCPACGRITSVVSSVASYQPTVRCAFCRDDSRGPAVRIISRTAVHRSKASKLERLDPKYDAMVDRAMSGTGAAEPDRLLRKMKPFPEDS